MIMVTRKGENISLGGTYSTLCDQGPKVFTDLTKPFLSSSGRMECERLLKTVLPSAVACSSRDDSGAGGLLAPPPTELIYVLTGLFCSTS